ncbi:MAG: hypothetical protein ACR2IS_17360 [Nitrososphaeraceae archaeon]
MISYSNREMLENHSDRFVYTQFFLARGVRDKGFDVDKVYGKLEMKGFNDQKQARAELVQDLEQQRLQRIQYNQSTNMVRHSDEGVQWARKECDKPLYLDYRDRQNTS